MSSYNLNELAGQDYFEFVLDNFKYKMSYPSSNDMKSLNELREKGAEIGKKIVALEKLIDVETDVKKVQTLQSEIDKLEEEAKSDKTTFFGWCAKYVTAQ